MVEQSEVMQAAYAQANETVNNANTQAQGILDSATNDANSIRMSAISYTDEMLATLSTIMADTLNDAGAKYNSFVSSLQSCYDVVNKNRSELNPQSQPAAEAPVQEQPQESEEVDFEEPSYDEAGSEEA